MTNYKTSCDKCGVHVSETTIWSYRWQDGKMHGRCRTHLKDDRRTHKRVADWEDKLHDDRRLT